MNVYVRVNITNDKLIININIGSSYKRLWIKCEPNSVTLDMDMFMLIVDKSM